MSIENTGQRKVLGAARGAQLASAAECRGPVGVLSSAQPMPTASRSNTCAPCSLPRTSGLNTVQEEAP